MTFTVSGDFVFTLLVNLLLIGVAWGTIRTQVNTLVAQARDNVSLRDVVTKLTAEVSHLQEAMRNQPQIIGSVVSETIKATLQYVRQPKVAGA